MYPPVRSDIDYCVLGGIDDHCEYVQRIKYRRGRTLRQEHRIGIGMKLVAGMAPVERPLVDLVVALVSCSWIEAGGVERVVEPVASEYPVVLRPVPARVAWLGVTREPVHIRGWIVVDPDYEARFSVVYEVVTADFRDQVAFLESVGELYPCRVYLGIVAAEHPGLYVYAFERVLGNVPVVRVSLAEHRKITWRRLSLYVMSEEVDNAWIECSMP
ncbi:hypothetical protein ES703_07361 [subsurface metagenome]